MRTSGFTQENAQLFCAIDPRRFEAGGERCDVPGKLAATSFFHQPSETSEHAQFFDSDKRFERTPDSIRGIEQLKRFERASILTHAFYATLCCQIKKLS